MTDKLLKKIAKDSRRGHVRSLVAEASKHTGCTVDEILGYSRKRQIARARQWVMWRARKDGLTYGQIAHALNRDHTTIIHGVKTIEALQ